jgi:hypothetical protein
VSTSILGKCTEFGDSVVVMGPGGIDKVQKKWSFGSHFMHSLKKCFMNERNLTIRFRV